MNEGSRRVDGGVDEVEVGGGNDGGKKLAIGADSKIFEGCAIGEDVDGFN